MSQTTLSGMTWPPAAQHASSAAIFILNKPAVSYGRPASGENETLSTLHMTVTQAPSKTASVLHPTMSTSLDYDPQSTQRKVTMVVTVTKSCSHNMTRVPEVSATRYPSVSGPLPATGLITRPITRIQAPNTANITPTEHLLRRVTPVPTVSRPAFTPQSKPQQSTDSSPPNHGAIIGGIIGSILAFLGLLVLIKLCRPRHKKPRDLERGHHHHRHRDTHAVLDEVQRRNQKRHRGHHRPAGTAAINLANARNWERGFDAKRFCAARPESVFSMGMSPEELAQTHAWNEGPAMDGLYGPRRHVPPAYPQYPIAMPTRKPVAQAGRMPSVKRTGRGREPVRSVSPLSEDGRNYVGAYGRGNYGDVSPIGSLRGFF